MQPSLVTHIELSAEYSNKEAAQRFPLYYIMYSALFLAVLLDNCCCRVMQPPLVTHIELSAEWPNKKAAQQALKHVAATFTQLERLEMSNE
jgi:hypothetical protein